jgi:hypothetical protein
MEVAWGLFQGAPEGWGRVQAVCDWVHANVRFDHQAARPTKTAYDVFVERAGVCRDFAHLALTFHQLWKKGNGAIVFASWRRTMKVLGEWRPTGTPLCNRFVG